MFKRVLIANRGEIALRILRTLKEMGIESVVVYSEADVDTLPVRLADRSVCIGPPDPAGSYLNVQSILSAAEITGCDAVHPGYGFLAENADFTELCEDMGLKFIGPTADVIRLMGDKVRAIQAAKEAGVPTIPGSGAPVSTMEEALEIASSVGYPVLLKAAAGGGGRGMRLVKDEEELRKSFDAARREAELGFGDPSIYVEKCIVGARHIEVQIIADEHGNVVHLGERECSVQRRHQKVLEEAPAVIDQRLREKICADAVKLAKAVGYRNAGTVEFLVDAEGNHYFIEMNTRIQVEHPVTEMITGMDMVKLQLQVASGERLGIAQEDVKFRGWAIEMRVNAEDPVTFAPSPGTLKKLVLPGGPGVRVDTAVYQGYTIPPYYDSMIAKIIVHGENRLHAIKRARRAVEECIVEGVKTTLPLHAFILNHEDFINANISVGWLESTM